MTALRGCWRWALTIMAIVLGGIALILLAARGVTTQADAFRGELESLLASRFSANAEVQRLGAEWHGWDPALNLSGVTLRAATRQGAPLLSLDSAQARLDTLASLRAGYPVFARADVERATVHLYQREDGGWGWPSAEVPEQVQSSRFRLADLDRWVGALLRQRVTIDDARVVLHGQNDSVTLVAPRLLMAGGDSRAHLEGRMHVAGEPSAALTAVLDVLPGQRGLGAFNAALQVDVNADGLLALGRVLTANERYTLSALEGDARLWARWHDARLEDARLRLSLPRLEATQRDGPPLSFTDIGLRAQALRDDDGGWDLWANGLSATRDDNDMSPLPERLQARLDTDGWWLRSSGFTIESLAPWVALLPLSDEHARMLDRMAPQGRVTGLELGRREGQWYSRAALTGAQVSAWDGIPGGGPFAAWITADGETGRVRFRGPSGMQLVFPDVYTQPLTIGGASGRVDWRRDGDAFDITGHDLRAVWRDAPVSGTFAVHVPRADDAPGHLDLDLEFADADAIETPLLEWLPTEPMDEELLDWLSRVSGRVTQGRLSLSQTLTEREAPEGQMFVNPDDRLQLQLDIEQGHLPYDPQWPALDNVAGHLDIDNQSLVAQVDHATSMGLETRDARVLMVGNTLGVRGDVSGSSQALLDYLAAAPLEELSETFAGWQSEGRVQADLDLTIPLAIPETMQADIQGRIEASRLYLDMLHLPLEDLTGDLRYRHRNDQDLLTGNVSARALGGRVDGELDMGGEGFTFDGRASAAGLLAWAGLAPQPALAEGSMPYRARVTFDEEDNASVRVTSDLAGLALHLPAPFGKTAGETRSLLVTSDVASGSGQVRLPPWGRARWRTQGDALQGQVWLEDWPQAPQWPRQAGWFVNWQPARLDPQQWISLLRERDLEADVAAKSAAQPREAGGAGGASSTLQRVSISTPCVVVDGDCRGALQAAATPLGEGWQLALSGPIAAGTAQWRPEAERPVDIDLMRLDLDTLWPSPEEGEDGPVTLSEEIATPPEPAAFPGGMAGWPDGRLHIGELRRQGQAFGPLDGEWRASAQRLTLKPVSLVVNGVTASGELTWEAAGRDDSLTRARLSLEGANLGDALVRLGQPEVVNSESVDIGARLAWPGAPWQFAVERSQGSISLALTNGRFRQIDPGPAKLVGLLNLDNIFRRLTLDFSDITREGTAFNSVTGEATLFDGKLVTRGPVEIDGSATHFTLQGEADLVQRTLDQRLGITVPVSQNLPLAAVLAGAPQVGVGLYLAHKLFGGWLDKATQIHYRVHGPWSSPQLTLESAR
ncbi:MULTISPECIES: YhdP family protein [Chromohalobacter]|uniref:YhdP family protein n=1 Tax=Chromohalobacter TaxID=42054 RepID=UPI001CC549A1|nr:YhdP family protein [Chromohalobacter salexigens]MBZ5874644.1 TIGR02099 family protein [Chromohalobacter salexigens]